MTTRIGSRSCFRAIVVAAALCVPGLVHADDEKPVAAIKTRAIEASVSIDEALKAYPGLYDTLLAEGRRGLAKWRVEADKDRKESPDLFRDGRRYTHDRAYTQRSAIGRYISVLRTDYFDGMGAHPNMVLDTILWDVQAKKPVSIRPLFKETADNGPTMQRLAKAIRTALAVVKAKRDMPVPDPDTDVGLSSVVPKLLDIGAAALAPSSEAGKSAGLLLYFSPYAVGGYVEGSYTAYLPWATFKDDLSPEGVALFGGDRPQADEEND